MCPISSECWIWRGTVTCSYRQCSATEDATHYELQTLIFYQFRKKPWQNIKYGEVQLYVAIRRRWPIYPIFELDLTQTKGNSMLKYSFPWHYVCGEYKNIYFPQLKRTNMQKKNFWVYRALGPPQLYIFFRECWPFFVGGVVRESVDLEYISSHFIK